MSTRVVHYPRGEYSNPSSIPIRQYSDVRLSKKNLINAMPAKPRFADNNSTFSQGRKIYLNAPICSSYIISNNMNSKNYMVGPNCSTGAIRVDALKDNKCSSVINQTKDPRNTNSNIWTRSNYSAPTRRKNIPVLNGKKNNVMSSQELISRRKNISIGEGTNINLSKQKTLSFYQNNYDNSHTNYLEANRARRRTRNSGYVVPPKCRVPESSARGSGHAGPCGALNNAGTGFEEANTGFRPIRRTLEGAVKLYSPPVGNSNASLVYHRLFTLTPSGGSGISVYLYSIGVNQWLSQRNLMYGPKDTPPSSMAPQYPNSFIEFLFNAYWTDVPSWAIKFDAFPKNKHEQQAYENVWTANQTCNLATWQGYLTDISNPITELWIIADGPPPSKKNPPPNNAIIFTKSTNNPVNDYHAIPHTYTGGTTLSL